MRPLRRICRVMAISDNDSILFAEVSEQLAALRGGHISPVDLVEAHLGRIESQPAFSDAWMEVFAESALEQAAALGSSDLEKPLGGIPVASKDLFDIAGMVTTAASPTRLGAASAPEDSHVIARLRQAGAIILGKTVLHEFAFGVTGVNPHFGTPPNPWRRDRVPGGSSSGSAVAVAIGAAPLALGSDTGGSIRLPSALCGISGHKPTYGFVSKRGVFPLSLNLDHAGPMARSAQDCAIMLDAIAGYDPRDPYCPPGERIKTEERIGRSIAGWRIAIPDDEHFADLQSEVGSAIERAAATLGELGAVLVEVPMPWAGPAFANNSAMVPAEAAYIHRELLGDSDLGRVSPDTQARLRAAFATSAVDYQERVDRRAEIVRAAELLLTEYDLLLTPSCYRTAGLLEGADTRRYLRDVAFTGIFDQTGQPSISVPCGFDAEGLPIGLMLTARRWRDDLPLTAAHAFQQATSWHRARPRLD
ncbi:MAG: amidase [Chloroflexota bacterium]|nr:amidase [Chloroflexota bacterium]MDE2936324.1 amidase [Chloroflexota bacterium]MXW27892.1 amidase [Chloroflexota bacterium]MYC46780.1 amidase [Chloroflexota bacterium]